MKQTVHKTSRNLNLPLKAGLGNNLTRKFSLTVLGAFAAVAAMAQTYTTKADGAWNSASTWVGGVIPSATITSGMTVNIKHDVTFNLTTDLSIAGKVYIDADTLRFSSTYDKKVTVAATGVLSVKNGGFVQSSASKKSDMDITGGRLIIESSRFIVSKSVKSTAGAKSTYKSSTVQFGEKYEVDGTSSLRGIDSVINSTIDVADGFDVKDYVSLRVSNAKIIVGKGFKVDQNADVTVLPGATNNYGFNIIKVGDDLENSGAWDARIDAYCVGKNVKGSQASAIDFTRPQDCSTTSTSTVAPELSFTSPVLKSGTDKKQGAVYRFSTITPGVDAEIKLKKFSRPDIVMNSIDNSTLGWNKAFQPEFGLPGVVAPNQDWYIDFEMTFYEAGTNKKTKVQRADFTALDVDGDGWSIAEYASFTNPANVAFSSFSSLSTTPAGSLGASLKCPICNVTSILSQCLLCHGTGDVLGIDCAACGGNGALYSSCNHAFEGIIGNVLQGPVQNYMNIDTNGTAVMATYQYVDVDKITFRYGAKSGAYSSNGSGIRLNSLWSKSFNLSPWIALPVNFASFSVAYDKGDGLVSWKAEQSENLSHFIVQRSTDGKNFADVATVFAGKTANYSYTDKSVSSSTGVVYYRVVSVDHTKETQQTAVKMIRLTKSEMQSLAIATYPNPVVNDIRITLPNSWQGKPVMLQLYTANGTIAKSIQLGSASQTETLSVNGFAKGLYIIKAVCGDEAAQQRVVKQ